MLISLNLSNKKMNKLNFDCLYLILNKLKLEPKSLYSCLFVNKEWYNIAVQILWKKYSGYFCRNKTSCCKIFNTILSCLPSSSNQLLSDNGIKFTFDNSFKTSII